MIKPDTIKQLESLKTSDTGRLAIELIEQMQIEIEAVAKLAACATARTPR